MKNLHKILLGLLALGLISSGALVQWRSYHKNIGSRNFSDDALLALIKNDQKAFSAVVESGATLNESLPLIDGKSYTIAEGMAYFERPNFIRYLQTRRTAFLKQNQNKNYDILSLSIPKNNPELLGLLIKENPDLNVLYGEKQWTLLHLASAHCAHKLTALLHKEGNLSWDEKAKDGSTPLTLAAESDCLPILSYWKEQKADFFKKDGRGLSAMSILRKKKDPTLIAFVQSFEDRKPTSLAAPKEINFYRKRKIPKDQIVDHAAMIEPDIRPLEASETAEFSEFAD